jgi:hypothetical protein
VRRIFSNTAHLTSRDTTDFRGLSQRLVSNASITSDFFLSKQNMSGMFHAEETAKNVYLI